jgi:hypothetical protein
MICFGSEFEFESSSVIHDSQAATIVTVVPWGRGVALDSSAVVIVVVIVTIIVTLP